MRHHIVLAIAAVSLLVTGCETASRRDSNSIQVDRTIGPPLPGVQTSVHFFIKRVDSHTYDITAFGDAYQTEQQYLDAWVRMADELAAGRPYEKQTTIEPAYYHTGGSPSGLVNAGVGTFVKGRMILK